MVNYYSVTVPPGVKSGQIVPVSAEGGKSFNVRVPDHVKPGQSFLFTLNNKQVPDVVIDGIVSSSPKYFHDYADLGMALLLGFSIGFSIVFGFVVGVLFVTM